MPPVLNPTPFTDTSHIILYDHRF